MTSLMCVALAIYFEARGEPLSGQIAVAQVIKNRIQDPRYPADACAVVKQGHYWGDHPIRDRCQFSFYCDGKSDTPTDIPAWRQAMYLAYLTGYLPDHTDGATHYHNHKVAPAWAMFGQVTTVIHKHTFYRGIP